ncbi:MAG: sodium:solute symporter [Hyphomicrobiaceae bacterium]|nr:sodium:solute symporter [Hyphomicrobiaceae bacterium]
MPHRHTPALANPLIGIYFGIFGASLGAIVVLLLIFEQLGVTDRALKAAMAFGSTALFAAIGAGAYTGRMREFVNAGRRVPAFYNGLSLTVAAFGGAGLTGFAGAMFLVGFDMLFLGLGIVAGLTVMVMLIAPFLRKFGAPTVPSYLGLRFDSGPVRLAAASVAVVPLMLVLMAEIKLAVLALAWLTPMSGGSATVFVVGVIVATIVPGGIRSLSWSSAAQALTLLVAVVVPAAIAAVIETNLPFGQLSHGPVMRAVARAEAAQDIPLPIAGLLTFDLPGSGLQVITGRYGTTFGTIGPLAFVLATLSVLVGIAGSPGLLARSVTTPTVFDTRKSIGWAVVLVALLITTFSAIAVFQRHYLMTEIAGQPTGSPPRAVQLLIELGHAAIEPRQAKIAPTSLLIERDATLVAMPVLLGLPRVVTSLVAVGILAAALAAAATSLAQLGLILAEDVINAPGGWRASDLQRLMTCRASIALLAIAAGVAAALASGDPLVLVLHALAFSGSTLFPVLVLSIWWKRLSALGALAGLAAGFGAAVAAVTAADVAGVGLPAVLAPVAAAPCAVAAAMIVSSLSPVPGRHVLEIVRDMRIPGGETVHDRELRQARQRSGLGT